MKFGFLAVAGLVVPAVTASAQSSALADGAQVHRVSRVAETAPTRAQPALRLTGLVHDSLTGFPLRGAVVQLVEAEESNGARSVVADERGRFQFLNLSPGRYRVGFHHPLLDTLGIEAPARAVEINAEATDVLLAVPSASHIRTALCGVGADGRTATLLTGTVYDARTGTAVPNTTVNVEWTEIDISKRTVTPRRVVRQTTTGANGWYGVCDVPREGVVQLAARTPSDSIDRVEMRLFDFGLNHQPLYFGSSATTRMAGVITRDGSSRPVANATVSVPNGPSVRTNAQGEYLLDAVPAGTRSLDVRAMGFYPERMLVNAIDDAPRVDVGLRSFKSVLDTVKVIANYQRYSVRQELAQRQRMGIGRFITEKDIARRSPIVLSDLLVTIPGVFLTPTMGMDQLVTMRGVFSSRCLPSLFLNGFALFVADFGSMPFTFADLSTMVSPSDVLAIEIYRAGQVPPALGAGMTGCGVISVWTR